MASSTLSESFVQRAAEHTCHAEGCSTHVPPAMFMCRPHWFALPKRLRAAVWQAYRPGQEVDMNPSPAYLEAAQRAIDHLADRTRPPKPRSDDGTYTWAVASLTGHRKLPDDQAVFASLDPREGLFQ